MMNKHWEVFKTLWKLQMENYRKDIFNLFSGWIITIITLIVWLSFKDTSVGSNSIKYDPFVVASAVGVSCIRNCLFNFIRTLNEFKAKNFFNKIFSTRVSKTFVFFSLIIFNHVINLLVSLIIVAIAMLYKDQRMSIQDVNWVMFISGYLLLVIMCNMIAFIVAFTIKKTEWALAIGNIYYYGAIFLLGLGIPYKLLAKNEFIIYISYIFPQRYALNIMDAGWINSSNMSYPDFDQGFGYGGHTWIPYLVSIILIMGSLILVTIIFNKSFEFENRKYKRFINKNKHLGIIYTIKRASSVNDLKDIIKVRNEINKSNETIILNKQKSLAKKYWKLKKNSASKKGDNNEGI